MLFCKLLNLIKVYFRCCCSVTQSCPTLCDPMEYTARRASLFLTISWSLPKFIFIASVTLSTISFSDALFFCPQPFPASGTFPMSWLFASDDQNTGTSASALVFSMKIRGWSSLRLTDLISLLSKGLAWVFSSTTVQRHQFFGILSSLQSSSHNWTWPLGRLQPGLYGPLSTG